MPVINGDAEDWHSEHPVTIPRRVAAAEADVPAESTECRSFSALDRSKVPESAVPNFAQNVSHRRRVTTAQTWVANPLVQPLKAASLTRRRRKALLLVWRRFRPKVTLVPTLTLTTTGEGEADGVGRPQRQSIAPTS